MLIAPFSFVGCIVLGYNVYHLRLIYRIYENPVSLLQRPPTRRVRQPSHTMLGSPRRELRTGATYAHSEQVLPT